jgi:hypothetical protein
VYTPALTTYNPPMRRLQIYIDKALDEALAVQALRLGISKAALIRRFVADRVLDTAVPLDPLDEMVGYDDAEPAAVNKVVYDR